MALSMRAMRFAMEAHRYQTRKYTGVPYFSHLAEVVGLVSTVGEPADPGVSLDIMLATAWLHDCMEDQGVVTAVLEREFGPIVATGVLLLSDLERGNRATRVLLSRERLSKAPGWVQTIKCADSVSNTSSIMLHDPSFAKVYLPEKRLLLEVLTNADPRLRKIAQELAA